MLHSVKLHQNCVEHAASFALQVYKLQKAGENIQLPSDIVIPDPVKNEDDDQNALNLLKDEYNAYDIATLRSIGATCSKIVNNYVEAEERRRTAEARAARLLQEAVDGDQARQVPEPGSKAGVFTVITDFFKRTKNPPVPTEMHSITTFQKPPERKGSN